MLIAGYANASIKRIHFAVPEGVGLPKIQSPFHAFNERVVLSKFKINS